MVPPNYNPDAEQVCPLKWLCCRQWTGKSLESSKGMLNAAGACHDSGEEEAGRQMRPLSKTGHELRACTCSLRKMYSLSVYQRILQGISVVTFCQQCGRFFFQSLHQSKSTLTAASSKTQAAKQRYNSTLCTPLYGTASHFIALICKAYSIKGFRSIFSTISLNIRLLPLFFF